VYSALLLIFCDLISLLEISDVILILIRKKEKEMEEEKKQKTEMQCNAMQ
jgi:hypothetical protein